MTNPLFHFAAGVFGSLIVFLLFAHLSGEKRFSFPSAVIIVGFVCAIFSYYLSPWATVVILALYILANVFEFIQYRDALKKIDKTAPRK
ncbi:MAG: hypothetical protein AB7S77_12240 [Desulfatirhabdiaceae bacterium]